ncbi:ABC transporter substrate-binding protein [Nitriliruptor alkaliphilus]|uniref:ABC transporter substrate-binding protein n=1 Tax=Nitriliruptor alkaliphilus TaxID=427918 RepID=UPI000696E592|nr:NrtA/SsuA/CpmA family ABC transporter substrate-binding protein [Nitriliruptor alkaliphilus]
MNHRSLRTAAAAAAVALALTACAGDNTAEPTAAAATDEIVTIKIGTLRSQPHLFHPFFYSDFIADGYEIEIVLLDSSPDIKNATVSGSVDFGITGIPSSLSGTVAGEDVVIIASAADGGTGIVGNPDIDGVTDLAGRTVGFPQGASQEILLRLTLEEHGLSIDDLELVNLPFAEMAGALASGQIEAFSSAEIGPSVAKQAGAVDIVDPYDTPVGKVNIGLVSTQSYVAANPETTQALIDAHIATVAFMNEDTDAWAQAVVDEFGMDPAVVETAVTNIWPRYHLDQAFLDQIAALATEMHALGYLDAVPDMADAVDTSWVE